MRWRVLTNKTPCGLRAAICVLRPVLRPVLRHETKDAAGRSTQVAACRQHRFSWVFAFMLINTQHASKIAENSVARLVETQR